MNNIAVSIGKHLEFDVPGFLQESLHVEHIITKRSCGLFPGGVYRLYQVSFAVHYAHTFSTTTAGGLDHKWISNPARQLNDLAGVIGKRAIGSRYTGNAR